MPSSFCSHLPTRLHSRPRSLSAISAGILAALGWLSLAAPQARAGVILVQHTSKDAGSTSSASLAFPANNAAGNWIGVVIRAGHSGQVLAVSDTRGNTYKQAVQFNQTLDVPNGETLAIYYAENIAGGANTVTVSESLANNTLRFAILEYSGLATSNSIDVTSAAQGSGTTLNSGTATTTVGGDLILGEVTSAAGVTFTAGSGYTIEERVPAAPNTKIIAEDAVQVAAGAVSVSATLSISENGGALLAAFKAAASGTLPPSITSLSPTSGPVGTSVMIAGANFGGSQGASTVTFNGVAATPTIWSATSITVPVPTGATTGNVVVTVGGSVSNGLAFTVTPPPPSITSLSPSSGPVGMWLTINGTNFGTTVGTVTFNGVPTTSGGSWSTTSISVAVPVGATTGNVVVTAGGIPSNGVLFTVTPAPVITSVSPASGAYGISVTLIGTGFGSIQGSGTVSFGGTVVMPTSWLLSAITFKVPNGATSGNVVVTVGAQPSNSVAFTVLPISVSLAPTTANVVVGTGVGLTATVQNDVQSQGVTWSLAGAGCSGATCGTLALQSSPYTIGYTAPSSVPNPPTIAVTATSIVDPTKSATSTITVTLAAPSITAVNPSIGPINTLVTISGANFGSLQGLSTVTFNGVAATTVTSWSNTAIMVAVPASATTGNVVVTVSGTASNGTTFTVIPPSPNIASLTPVSGQVGASVTIAGTGFSSIQGGSSVTFNGIGSNPTSWSNTGIVAPVPPGATSGNVVVTVGSVASNGVNFSVIPNIASISPISGAVGTPVTITGTGFSAAQGASSVSFNGTAATPTSWSATSIVAPVPAGTVSGNVVVTVGGVASNNFVPFTVFPNITSLNPSSGPVGTSFTINGSNFGATRGFSSITFNTIPVSPTSWSDTSIVASVPTGATTGNVVVTVGSFASNGVSFTVTPSPNITNLSPSSGPVGVPVTISGSNFGATQGGSRVLFNGAPAAPTSWSATSIVAPVPTGASTGLVFVILNGGAGSNGMTFTVGSSSPSITSLSPSLAPVGTSVTITGTSFGASQGASTVTFNETAATPTAWTATSITVPVPAAATTGNVIVTVGGQPSNGLNFTVTIAAPNINGLNPTSGPVGTPVTIAGTNFGSSQGASTVTFNGVAATATIWSATSLTVAVPTGATTGNVVVTVGGQPSNGLSFTVTAPPPTLASLSPPFGLVGTSVIITGTNFGISKGTSTVTFSGVTAVPTSWNATSIVAPVPNGATTGNVFVTVGGVASNGSNFTVTVPPAPVTLVQHNSKDAGSTSSSTLAFKSNNTAGNWIAVVARAGKSGQIFTVSDSLQNTYRMAAQFNVTVDTPNGDTLGIFYAENIAGGANTVTVADTISGNTLRFAIFEYSGVAHTNSLDAVIAGQGTNAAPNSGGVTTSMNGDLLLGAAMTAGPATYTAGPGYKIEEFVPAEPNTKLIAEDQIQAVAGIASASATLGASDHWGAILAAFRPGNGGITGPAITALSPTFAPVGTSVTINGTNFGSSQGTSTVSFNGTAAIPSSWSATSIVAPVPGGASTGTVVVTVGGVASNGVSFTVTVPPPSIAGLNPSSALAGNGAFTLTVNGTNFLPSSVIQWNGNARTTAFVSNIQLQTTITAGDIASAGVAKVTVSNPGLGGTVSSAAAFFIGTSGGSNFAVLAVNQAAQDIVYDPKNQVFYLSVTALASTNPNTISVLDPATAAITSTQLAGINPNVLAISDDSQFLYAGVDGSASVQRFILPGPAPDISYALGSGTLGPYFALDLQVAPGAPHTTAVTLGNSGASTAAQGGITIFDDATPRTVRAGGGASLFGSIQWGTDATSLYASNNESTGFDFYTLSVNSGGVTLNQDFQYVFRGFSDKIHFDAGTNLIYAEEGHVINPSTGLPVGNFNAVGPMVVDSSLNTAFFLSGGSGSGATIQAFDLTHFTPIGSATIPNATGTLSHLIRWGQDGLAFISTGANGSGQVFLVGGSFVGPAPAFITTPPPNPTIRPTPLPNAPTITSLFPSSAIVGGAAIVLTVNGAQFDPVATVQFNGAALSTIFVSSTQLQATIPASDILTSGTASITVANPLASGGSSSGSTFFIGASGGFSSAGTGFAVQIVNQASKDIVFDPVDQLFYLSVPNSSPSGNTIAVLDPSTAQIVGEQYAGSNPNVIAVSDDGQFLYAGIDGSSSVQRFTLPGLATDIRYPLAAKPFLGPLFALDLQVAPGVPRTTAVTSGAFNVSPAAEGGISIFDDAAMRPTVTKGFGPGGGVGLYDSLQWGPDATNLYAANDEDTAFDFYALSVNSTGVVLTSDYLNKFSSFSNRIHFDGGTKLIYSDDGHVVNPSTGASAGTFLLTGLVAPIMVPDSNLNVGFFAAKTGGSSVVIYSFNLSTFAPIGSILISNVTGSPLRLIRWGQSGLAFNTDAGKVVLVGGNFVH
jgi:hypothetical protein